MAFFNLRGFRKSFLGLICCRSQKYIINNQNIVCFSTSERITNCETPVKFTANKASKITISELIDPRRKNHPRLWYERYVIFSSVIIFLVYFLILREENHIDEILKGNTKYWENTMAELIVLKQKLKYCENKHLPTTELRKKIKLLEDKIDAEKSHKIAAV